MLRAIMRRLIPGLVENPGRIGLSVVAESVLK